MSHRAMTSNQALMYLGTCDCIVEYIVSHLPDFNWITGGGIKNIWGSCCFRQLPLGICLPGAGSPAGVPNAKSGAVLRAKSNAISTDLLAAVCCSTEVIISIYVAIVMTTNV